MQTQNNKVNGNRTILIHNYFKCKWVECPNQKTKTGWMDTKTRPLYMLSTRDPPQNKGHIQTESEGLEKNISHKWDQKKAGVAILISDKIDFKIKAVKRDKEGHYIMIKGSIQEEITIINIYAPNIGAPQYVKQMIMSMKGKIKNNTMLEDFNTSFTPRIDQLNRK